LINLKIDSATFGIWVGDYPHYPPRLRACLSIVGALLLLSSDELMSWAASTIGCLDLRRPPFPLDGQMSAEWITTTCPGSMARRARDSVAPLRGSSASWVPARIGKLSARVGRKHPVTIHKTSLKAGSMRRVWSLRHQTGTPGPD